jgi:peptide/nickel transport system permease protein
MIFLWSDLFIFLIFFISLTWFYFARKRDYWRDAVKRVASQKKAMVSFWVLCFYVTLALLDSVHFREPSMNGKGGHIVSMLDRICQRLIDNTEKTYSAPFALESYSKETFFNSDGTRYRAYPRLKKTAADLKVPGGRNWDIAQKIIYGIILGASMGLILFVMYRLWYSLVKNKFPGVTAARLEHVERRARKLLRVIAIFAMIIFPFALLSGSYHILGTDKAGFDVLYNSLKGARTGIIIGTLTTLIVTPFAIFFGIIAGYLGGWVDDLVQYIYTTLSSIPDILLIAAAMLIFQVGVSMDETVISADKRLLYLCVILGITSWTGLCRLIRGEVLKLRELEYIEASRALGVSALQIMLRHLVPNTMHIVLITVILRFSGLVLAEAVLSYIGIGVDPSMQSWGNMINQARLELARDPVVWWNLFASFAFMLGLVLPANIFGDAVRDALDPRLKGL